MTAKTPTLTVFTPNYNQASTLVRALESVVTQSRPPDQWVIVDDGSTDGSQEIIERYAARYSYIEFYRHEKNQGAIAAVKTALSHSKGDYLYGLACDDYFLEGWLEQAMKFASHYPQAGVIFGRPLVINTETRHQKLLEFDERFSSGYIEPTQFQKYLDEIGYYFSFTSATLYRRDILNEMGGFRRELFHYCDVFSCQMALMKYGGCYVDWPAHCFSQDPKSFSSRELEDTQKTLDLVARIDWLLKESEYKNFIPEYYSRQWVKKIRQWAFHSPAWRSYLRWMILRDRWIEERRGKCPKWFLIFLECAGKGIAFAGRLLTFLKIYKLRLQWMFYKGDVDCYQK